MHYVEDKSLGTSAVVDAAMGNENISPGSIHSIAGFSFHFSFLGAIRDNTRPLGPTEQQRK